MRIRVFFFPLIAKDDLPETSLKGFNYIQRNIYIYVVVACNHYRERKRNLLWWHLGSLLGYSEALLSLMLDLFSSPLPAMEFHTHIMLEF